jgi:hypothetical protein
LGGRFPAITNNKLQMNKLSFELCEKLKKVGFPQKYKHTPCTKEINGHNAEDHLGMLKLCGNMEFNINAIPADTPTLSELIEACLNGNFEFTLHKKYNNWEATLKDTNINSCSSNIAPFSTLGVGNSPEEAVANLYIALSLFSNE